MSTTAFAHRIDAAIERLIIKELNATTFLVCCSLGLSLVPFQSSWLLPLVVLLSNLLLQVMLMYQWFANGLTLAGRRFLVLDLRSCFTYLPVRRHLHYFALGFGLTAMLTVLYSNVQSLGAAISAIVGTDAFANFQKNKWLPLLTTSNLYL